MPEPRPAGAQPAEELCIVGHGFRTSRLAKLGVLLVVAVTAATAVGCHKNQDEAKAEAQKQKGGDRYSDGQRLARELKSWPKQWKDMPDLPSCELLLKDPADLELCKTAANHMAIMKAAVAKPEDDRVLVHEAAELTLATYLAWEKLDLALTAKRAPQAAAAPSASATPAAAPSASAAPGKGKTKAPVPSSSAHDKAKPGVSASASASASAAPSEAEADTAAPDADDPAQALVHRYHRTGQLSRRYLIKHLIFGPLPTRNFTFDELAAIAKRKSPYRQLGHTLLEAFVDENDPTLKAKEKALGHSLRDEPVDAKE